MLHNPAPEKHTRVVRIEAHERGTDDNDNDKKRRAYLCTVKSGCSELSQLPRVCRQFSIHSGQRAPLTTRTPRASATVARPSKGRNTDATRRAEQSPEARCTRSQPKIEITITDATGRRRLRLQLRLQERAHAINERHRGRTLTSSLTPEHTVGSGWSPRASRSRTHRRSLYYSRSRTRARDRGEC